MLKYIREIKAFIKHKAIPLPINLNFPVFSYVLNTASVTIYFYHSLYYDIRVLYIITLKIIF